jgi:hypothetical protein
MRSAPVYLFLSCIASYVYLTNGMRMKNATVDYVEYEGQVGFPDASAIELTFNTLASCITI